MGDLPVPSTIPASTVDVASGTTRTVTTTDRVTLVDHARWSTDGQRPVVQVEHFTDDETVERITDVAMFATYPDCSSSRDQIVFTTHDCDPAGGLVSLSTVNPDGSGLRLLDTFRASHPRLQP